MVRPQSLEQILVALKKKLPEAKCHDAAYRVTQDGINTMRSVCTKQNVTTHSLDDIKILLEEELPNIEKFR